MVQRTPGSRSILWWTMQSDISVKRLSGQVGLTEPRRIFQINIISRFRFLVSFSSCISSIRPGLHGPVGSVNALSLQKKPEGHGEQSAGDVLPADRPMVPSGHGDGTDEASTQKKPGHRSVSHFTDKTQMTFAYLCSSHSCTDVLSFLPRGQLSHTVCPDKD